MSRLDRYYSDFPIRGGTITLAGPEAHHLIHVMRAKPGLRVVIFDGSGWEFTAEIQAVRRSEALLAIVSSAEVDRELPVEVTLGVALPKGDRQKWLVEKAVELGVARLVPLRTARSVAEAGEGALGRLQRSVVEASKQCGRNRMMEIASSRSWESYLVETRETEVRLLAHPGAESTVRPAAASRRIAFAVGPEGGFTDEEIAAAGDAGWRRIDLGPRILRVETAATALAARALEFAGT